MTTCGSISLESDGLVKVPGMKRPIIPEAPVASQNFCTGVFPYSLADVTIIFEMSALPINFALRQSW